MATSERERLDGKPCPNCGKVGGLSWDYASRSVRCSFCYVSGMEETEVSAPTNKVETPPPPAEPADKKQRHVVDATQTVDAYKRGKDIHYVTYYHRLDPKPPELFISLKSLQFHRWRLQDQIDNERRYGRDDLRKRGFVVVEKGKFDGKVVKIMAKPDE